MSIRQDIKLRSLTLGWPEGKGVVVWHFDRTPWELLVALLDMVTVQIIFEFWD